MTACPSQEHRDDLARLLSGDLPEAEQARLTTHLDACIDCRKALDALAARSGLWGDLALLRDDEPHEPTEDLAAVAAAGSPDDEELPLGLLEAVDEPGLLGKLGPYDVLRAIGRGGMGIVFLGRDRALDRLVAIKVLTPGMSATPAARRRFAREARAAAAVVHEHVVAIHAVESLPQGVPYLVMQYIAGKSVQDVIDRDKPPELAEILRIGSQAASALAAAHAQGLIHRDVKPANILLENGVERVKITDFGLARAVDDATMTQSGVVAGTPQYMSPEQAAGDAVDHRTDLFSLGSVLYTLCTGQAPFRGRSSMATLRKVCEETPRPIRGLNPEIPPWLVRIIDRLHAKDPADRYGSAAEVAGLLGRCLAHVQQPANAPLPAELLPPRKRRAAAIWAAVPVGLLLVGLLSFPGAREAAGQAVGYVATVLRLRTPEGTLVIETEDPDVGIKLDGSELVVTGAGVKELRLSVGEHNIQAVKDGKVLRDELVSISRGGRTVLTVRREAEAMPPPSPASLNPIRDLHPDPSRFLGRGQVRTEKSEANATFQGSLLNFITPASSAPEVARLADVLKRNPPRPDSDPREGMRLYMRDLAEGRTVPIVDPTMFGMRFAETPTWSHDGRRILFHVQPRKSDGRKARLVMIEDRNGRPDYRDLGEGACPSFSPDDRTIAFLLFPGEGADVKGGVWLMNVDGTNRRRVGDYGNPYWSPDGFDLLINSWGEPTVSKLYNFAMNRTVEIKVPGRRIYSAPRWAGPGLLVACLGDEKKPDCIVLLDVSRSSTAEVVRTLWRRSSGPDVFPRWPVISPATGECYFIGDEGNKRTLYSLSTESAGRERLSSLDSGGHKFSGLSLSPDGRYLLFASDQLDPVPSGRASASLGGNPAQEVDRLAKILGRNPPLEANPGRGTKLYMRDLIAGRTAMFADTTAIGLPFAEVPDWSHDGRRIVFRAKATAGGPSQVILLESRDGRPNFRGLGSGDCPRFSPDDRSIAFLLWSGSEEDPEGGIWMMNADGAHRRKVAEFGAPFWSPDGTLLLINGQFTPNEAKIYSLESGRTIAIAVPGRKIYSWARWAGPSQLVACVGAGDEPDSIVLLDVRRPDEARIVRTVWNRGEGPDVPARWPLVSPSTGECFFVGDAGATRTLYSLSADPAGAGRPIPIEVGGPKLGSLGVSPDGRYLLFASDRLDPEPSGRTPASLGDNPAQEADRLVGMLRRNPPRPGARTGERMQLYMRDLSGAETTLIMDEPAPGLGWTGAPDWSHDGTRIAFDASPGKDWAKSRLMILEAGDGRPRFRDLGAGNCPRFSPDDRRIAFLLNPGAAPGEESGVYIMSVDGADRRRIGGFGAPFWSEDGQYILIDSFSDPTDCDVVSISTGETTRVSIPGRKIFSWPRWAGPEMLVACVGDGNEPDAIVLLDVSRPSQSRIVETIWRRSPEQDVYARWPLYSPRTGTCYFVGAACGFAGEGKKRTLLAVKRGGAGRSKPVEGQGGEDDLGGLTFSPDGRYLLFGANRPDRAEESTGERRSQSGTSPLRPSDRPARLLTGL